jgi:hypothetical protein
VGASFGSVGVPDAYDDLVAHDMVVAGHEDHIVGHA